LILKRTNPDYSKLYKKIKINHSYTFEISIIWSTSDIDAEIVNILTPRTYVIDVVIEDLINLSVEGLPSMMELITNDEIEEGIRLVACESHRNDIAIGKKYTIKYLKGYQGDMCIVVSLQ